MAEQSSLMCYLKKASIEEEDTPLPSSIELTQPSYSDSLAHKNGNDSPAACPSVPVLSPSQPDVGLPAD